ncbi:MAG: thermonuclease family protein [Patescibacteria group bacterium]
MSLLRKIPGFRSKKWWKTLIALGFYLFISLIVSVFLFPTAPTLALEKIDPTNKDSVSVVGKTYPNKPVFLLKSNETVQSVKSGPAGKFHFVVNDLIGGNYPYTIKVCDPKKENLCRTENILIVVDQTPPVQPMITIPDELPDEKDKEIIIKGISEPNTKIVASVQDKELSPVTANDKGEFEVKTSLTPGPNIVSIKTIDIAGNESTASNTSINFNPIKQKTKVIKVIDGDTIKIEGDGIVRYIGIDTPETVHPNKPVQCYGEEASSKNKELVEGKEVILEKDISETDKYGRLLRYVWLGDILVNEYLVKEGYAQSSSYPPDVKYQNQFVEAQRQAREEKKGLWGDVCNSPQPTQAQKNIPQPTIRETTAPIPAQVKTSNQSSESYGCDCSKTCSQMSSCAEAQYQLNTCGCTARDADKDGIACDSDCQ